MLFMNFCRRVLFTLLLSSFLFYSADAQVFNCGVRVKIPPDLAGAVDQDLIQDMERNITQLFNHTSWTSETYKEYQRLTCELSISITATPSRNQYEASAQWLLLRPVYRSSYESVLMSYTDTEWSFEYLKGQPLRYIQGTIPDELTGLIAFYAYLCLALDADSFAEEGGTKYLQQAYQITTMVPSAGSGGWSQFGSLRNRYWLIDNLLNPQFTPLRAISYEYHRQGMDLMTTDAEQARSQILEQVRALKDILKSAAISSLGIMWIDSKYRELISIFSQGTPSDRREAYELLKSIDPTRTEKYRRILPDR